jgi:predicted MFS family arabinose efflux permease
MEHAIPRWSRRMEYASVTQAEAVLPGAVTLPAPAPRQELDYSGWMARSSGDHAPSFKKAARKGVPSHEGDSAPPLPKGRDEALMVIFGVCVVDGMAQALTYPVMPFFVEELGGDSTTLGMMFGTFAAFATVASATCGWLSDQVGRRPVLLVSLLGTSVGMFLSGQATSVRSLFVARALLGLFAGTVPVAAAYIADIARPTERTKLLSLTGVATGTCYAVGPAFGAALARYSIKLPFDVGAATAFAGFWFALAFLKDSQQVSTPSNACSRPHPTPR